MTPILILLLATLPNPMDDWAKASRAFHSALVRESEKKLEEAVHLVVQDNSKRAAKLLVKGLRTRNNRFYWKIITGLSEIGSREGVESIVEEIISKSTSPTKRDLTMALQVNNSPFATAGFLRILTKGSPDLQLIAMDDLVKRGVREAIPVMIGLLEEKRAELKRQAGKALRALTGLRLEKKKDCEQWWKKHGPSFQIPKPKTEKEEGEKEKKSKGTVAGTLQRNRTTDFEDLQKLPKHEIIVVKGEYDEIQQVLVKMSIPHTVVERKELLRTNLKKASTILVNCANYPESPFQSHVIKKIRAFVAGGGYLFSSDWGLADVLEKAFPGYVKVGSTTSSEVIEKADIHPRRGSTGHPFLKEVFVKISEEGKTSGKPVKQNLEFQWLVDAVSYTIKYDPKRVIVLIEAPDLKAAYKDEAVAVTFSYGTPSAQERTSVKTGGVYEDLRKMKGGKVLHVLSHFRTQGTKNDEFAIQNMLLNFLIEAKDRKRMRER